MKRLLVAISFAVGLSFAIEMVTASSTKVETDAAVLSPAMKDSASTASSSLENEDDPLADQPNAGGDYTDYSYKPAKGKIADWEKTADSIIMAGMPFMGTPYQFGAKLGQTQTFDCSSFTHYMFGKQNIKLPRNSRQQSALGREINLNQLRKGDLLFFSTPKRKDKTGVDRIGHVSVYLGDNKMLHTYRVGIGVTVSEFDDKWRKRLITIKRIIE